MAVYIPWGHKDFQISKAIIPTLIRKAPSQDWVLSLGNQPRPSHRNRGWQESTAHCMLSTAHARHADGTRHADRRTRLSTLSLYNSEQGASLQLSRENPKTNGAAQVTCHGGGWDGLRFWTYNEINRAETTAPGYGEMSLVAFSLVYGNSIWGPSSHQRPPSSAFQLKDANGTLIVFYYVLLFRLVLEFHSFICLNSHTTESSTASHLCPKNNQKCSLAK